MKINHRFMENRHFKDENGDVKRGGMNSTRRVILSVLLIVAGLVWLASNMGYLPEIVSEYIISWQALLIGTGFVQLIGKPRKFWSSIALIFIGSIFLYSKFYVLPVDAKLIVWPALLIFLGLIVLSKARHEKSWNKRLKKTTLNSDSIDDTSIFGSNKYSVRTKQFNGGQSTCIFGGSEIDFSNAELNEGENIFEITCIFGGLKLLFPADWNVIISVDSILGGVSDKRQIVTDKHIDYTRSLTIKGTCVFGGAEIESFVRM
jgi:predicted membrane protein